MVAVENHCFNIAIASKYGIKAAVLFQNLWFWVRKNSSEGRNIVDGRAWTYNTIESLSKQLPYLSTSAIQRELQKMEKARLIIKGNFNSTQFNRTCWYTIGDEGYAVMLGTAEAQSEEPSQPETFPQNVDNSVENSAAIIQNRTIEDAKTNNRECENEESKMRNRRIDYAKSQNVTDINTYINTTVDTDIKPTLGTVRRKSRDPPVQTAEPDDYDYKSWLAFIGRLGIEQPEIAGNGG